MARAKWELLFDSAGDGFTTATTEAGDPPRVAGQYSNFNSCAIRSADGARVRVAKADFLASTETFALVFAVDFDGDHTAASDRTLLDITEDASNWIRVYHRASDDAFVLEVRSGGATEDVDTGAQSWTAGDGIVLVCYATADELGIAVSIAQAAIASFETAARAQGAPTLTDTTVDLGRREDGTLYLEGAVAYVAALSAEPSAAEASAFAEAQRPPLFGEHVAREMAALWYGKDTAYLDDPNDVLTPDTTQLVHEHGRDYPSTRSGRAVAGKLTASLRNDSGRYSPSNAASPLTGLLKPRRKVRLRAADEDQHYARWSGFLTAAPRPRTLSGGYHEALLEAHGPLQEIQDKKVRLAGATSVETGTRVGAVLDDAAWPAADRDVDDGQETMAVHWAEDVRALTAGRELEETEGPSAWLHESNDGDLVFADRHRRLTAARSTTSQATFEDDPAADNPVTELEEVDPLGEVFNEIIVPVRPVQAAGSEATLWTLSTTEDPTIAPGESRTFFAKFPGTERPEGAYVSAWTTPDATDVGVSGVTFGDLTIAVTKLARTMIIKVTNDHATDTATITSLRARGTPVDFADPVEVPAEDTTSQDTYGERSWPVTAPWLSNVLTAKDQADALLSRYKDPVPLFRMTLSPQRSEAHLGVCLALELDDLVTIDADGDVYGIDGEDCFVERLREQVGPAGLHMLQVELSASSGDAGFWALGISTLGETTKLAY